MKVQMALAKCKRIVEGLIVIPETSWNLVVFSTPWKINMEPTNHPFRKEHDLPNLHYCVPC